MRTYNIPLRKGFQKVARWRRTKKAVSVLKKFLKKVSIKKIILNLVGNAIEASKDGGKIKITTKNQYVDSPIKGYDNVRVGEYIVFEVSDTGHGIPPQYIDRIFEPFFTKKKLGLRGTGLGLAIVWNVVQDHNGYIDIESSSKGTTFKIYFPAVREEISTVVNKTDFSPYKGSGENILIIDDEENQREILKKMVTFLGYRAFAVSGGKEAVQFIKNNLNKIDLLILDMILEDDLNGRKTYEKILEIVPGQKAIIVSGMAATNEIIETQKLGAGKYLKKPYKLIDIASAIKKELQRRRLITNTKITHVNKTELLGSG